MLTEPEQQFFTRSRSVVSRMVGGETLIVPLRGKVGDLASIYSFNGIASVIWQLLNVPRPLTELISAVERECEVRQEQALKDVTQLVDDMFSVGLVELYAGVAMTATESKEKEQVEVETAGSR